MTPAKVAMREAFGEALLDLASEVPEMVVLDADVSSSTRTAPFGQRHPDRFFNVGVAEANMVDIAAGMATCGLRPVVSTFALFIALKAADQLRNIVCYNNLPVVLAGSYAGLSDSFDGASHQAILDVAMMRALPNMAVVVPADGVTVRQALSAALRRDGPTYIRICRNPTPILFADASPLTIGEGRRMREGEDLTLVVCGIPTSMAVEAADRLARRGVAVDLIELATIKPIDAELLIASARKTGKVLTVEEHTVRGGLGSAVAEVLAEHAPVRLSMVGIQDVFTESGPYDALLRKYGISVDHIESEARRLVTAEVRPPGARS